MPSKVIQRLLGLTPAKAVSNNQEVGNNGSHTDDDTTIQPCPYIRPLENRMEARIESCRIIRGPRSEILDAQQSQLSPLSSQVFSGEDGQPPLVPAHGSEEDDSYSTAASSEASGNLIQPWFNDDEGFDSYAAAWVNFNADQAARSSDDIKAWRMWLRCYRQVIASNQDSIDNLQLTFFQGYFNFQKLPATPDLHEEFQSLTSIITQDDAKTFEIANRFLSSYSHEAVMGIRDVLSNATETFGLKFGAISFVTGHEELIQFAHGWEGEGQAWDLEISLASHCLLSSNGIMAVEDCSQVGLHQQFPALSF
jgi:hypothetical protein